MSKITIQNEEGQNLNRYKMTPVDGQANTYDLERVANITKQGTPFSPDTMGHYVQEEDFTAHTQDASIHTSTTEKAKFTAGIVATYIHTKVGTVHNLAGAGNNIEFLPTAGISDGDTWTVNGLALINGTAVTATLQNGDPLPADLFKAGSWVTGIRLDGAKLNFKSAGGGVKYNVFCQPTEPPTKQGIWLKTAAIEAIKKITFDTSPYAAMSWIPTSFAPVEPYDGGAGYTDYGIIGDCLFSYHLYYKKMRKYSLTTNTWTLLADAPLDQNVSGCVVYNRKFYSWGQASSGYYGFCYDPDTNTYPQTNLAIPPFMYHTNPIVYGNKCIAWTESSGSALNHMFYYNFDTNTWTNVLGTSGTSFNKGYAALLGSIAYVINDTGVFRSFDLAGAGMTGTYVTLASLPSGGGPLVVINNKIYCLKTSENSYVYDPSTNVWIQLSVINLATAGQVVGQIGNYIIAAYPGHVPQFFTLTAKVYPDDPTAVLYYLPNDITYVASLLNDKKCDYLPSYFKDAMLYQNSNLTYPSYYVGNGVSWNKIR